MAALRDEAVWGGPRPSPNGGDAGPAPEQVWDEEDFGPEGFLRDVDRRVADFEAGLRQLLDEARRQAERLVSDARMEAGRIIAAARSEARHEGAAFEPEADEDAALPDAPTWDPLDAIVDLDRVVVELMDDQGRARLQDRPGSARA
jgi:hypothetical protein